MAEVEFRGRVCCWLIWLHLIILAPNRIFLTPPNELGEKSTLYFGRGGSAPAPCIASCAYVQLVDFDGGNGAHVVELDHYARVIPRRSRQVASKATVS